MTLEIVTREHWGARHGQGLPTSGAKTRFIAHHDGIDRSKPGMSVDQESAVMQLYEDFHASDLTKNNPRIGYSFVVFQSGRVYEGCGWGRIGAHTQGLNSSAYAACFPINGAKTAPTSDAVAAFRALRADGVQLKHLTPNHSVSGHQDHGKPSCPGKLVYQAVVAPELQNPPTIAQIQTARPSLRLGKGGKNASAAERYAVQHLQRLLLLRGYFPETQRITGYFGEITEASVRAFQRDHLLTVDGAVGSQTWRALGG